MVTGRQARYHTWSFRRILSGHPVPILVQLIAVPCYVYRMQVQLWHQVLMLLASARIKLLGCPACSLFRWLAPVSSDCSCYVVARRPPNYEPDCCCYLFFFKKTSKYLASVSGSYITSSSMSINWSRKISRLSMFFGLAADTHR